MKTAKTLKYGKTKEIRNRVKSILSRVPFLKIDSFKSIADVYGARPDFLLEIKANKRPMVLVIEAKTVGQPREIRNGLLQLQRFMREASGKSLYGVMVAPFISEESAQLCKEAGVGYIDLAGNARLCFDSVFVETRSPENPFREKREGRSLFAPKATRVLRHLLQGPLRAWKVSELAESAKVSLGWVSAVRQQLLAREWAAEEPNGFRVTKPASVLDAWAKTDDWQKRTTVHEYSLLTAADPARLAENVHEILRDEQPVFTQFFAASLRHPHTIAPVVTAYITKFPAESSVEKQLMARRVSSGGKLRLVLPKDEGVLHPSQKAGQFRLVSDAQIYLDLLKAGQRGEEQAAELRKWPDFAGGWG